MRTRLLVGSCFLAVIFLVIALNGSWGGATAEDGTRFEVSLHGVSHVLDPQLPASAGKIAPTSPAEGPSRSARQRANGDAAFSMLCSALPLIVVRPSARACGGRRRPGFTVSHESDGGRALRGESRRGIRRDRDRANVDAARTESGRGGPVVFRRVRVHRGVDRHGPPALRGNALDDEHDAWADVAEEPHIVPAASCASRVTKQLLRSSECGTRDARIGMQPECTAPRPSEAHGRNARTQPPVPSATIATRDRRLESPPHHSHPARASSPDAGCRLLWRGVMSHRSVYRVALPVHPVVLPAITVECSLNTISGTSSARLSVIAGGAVSTAVRLLG